MRLEVGIGIDIGIGRIEVSFFFFPLDLILPSSGSNISGPSRSNRDDNRSMLVLAV